MSTLLRMDSTIRFNVQNTNLSISRGDNSQGASVAAQGNTSRVPLMAKSSTDNGKGAQNQNPGNGSNKETKSIVANRFDRNDCRSCKTRQYMDGSNDPGVSFKTPTTISPGQSAVAVAAHENEHVTRNKAAAEAEGREVVSQSVILHTAVCNECGVTYTAGGETTTVTKAKNDPEAIQPRLNKKA